MRWRVTWLEIVPASSGMADYTQHKHFNDRVDAERYFARLIRFETTERAALREVSY